MGSTSYRAAPIGACLASLLIASSALPLVEAEQANKTNGPTSERLQKATAGLEAPANPASQALPTTTAAEDLPAEFTLLLRRIPSTITDGRLSARTKRLKSRRNCTLNSMRFTRSGISPWRANRSVFKFEFTRPIRKGGNVFHVYVKADGDEKTGRKHDGIHNGVDYMFTVIDGDPQSREHQAGRFRSGWQDPSRHLQHRDSGGNALSGRRNDPAAARRAFRIRVLRVVVRQGTTAPVPAWGIAVLPPRRRRRLPTPGSWSIPDVTVINGTVPGWQLVGGSRPMEAKLAADSKDGALVLENLFWPEGLSQTVSLAPGHYLLRALAKTNVFQIHLVAESMRLPVAVSDEYQWVELPFCIPRSGEDSVRAAQVGFRYLARPATGNASRLPARLAVKHVELVRLGDTVLNAQWAETLPADRLHRMKLINAVARLEPSGEGRLSGRLPRDRTVVDDPGRQGRPYLCRSSQFQPRRQVPAHRVPQAAARASPDGRFSAVSERRLDGHRLAVPLGTEASARRVRSRGLDRHVTQPRRNPTAQRGDAGRAIESSCPPVPDGGSSIFPGSQRTAAAGRTCARSPTKRWCGSRKTSGPSDARNVAGEPFHDIPGAEHFLAAGRGHAVRRHVQCRRESRGQLARRGGPRRQPVFSLRDQPGPLPRPPDQSVSSLGPVADAKAIDADCCAWYSIPRRR